MSAQSILNLMKKMNIPRRLASKHTNRTIQKQSKIKVGNKNPMFGIKRPEHSILMKKKMKGRKLSILARQKMSNAKKGICGPNHNTWIEPDKRKGTLNKNIRRLKEMKEWRHKVFEKDDYTCVDCGKRGSYLHADHIKPLHFLLTEYKILKPSDAVKTPEIWNVENGRTLCVPCHKLTKTFGAKIRKFNEYK